MSLEIIDRPLVIAVAAIALVAIVERPQAPTLSMSSAEVEIATTCASG